MHTTAERPPPRRLGRTALSGLLMAPLAVAGLGATVASASDVPHDETTTTAAVEAVDVSAAICANCHQTINHLATAEMRVALPEDPGAMSALLGEDGPIITEPQAGGRKRALLGEDGPLETVPHAGGRASTPSRS